MAADGARFPDFRFHRKWEARHTLRHANRSDRGVVTEGWNPSLFSTVGALTSNGTPESNCSGRRRPPTVHQFQNVVGPKEKGERQPRCRIAGVEARRRRWGASCRTTKVWRVDAGGESVHTGINVSLWCPSVGTSLQSWRKRS
jgi:hypothetical protein